MLVRGHHTNRTYTMVIGGVGSVVDTHFGMWVAIVHDEEIGAIAMPAVP